MKNALPWKLGLLCVGLLAVLFGVLLLTKQNPGAVAGEFLMGAVGSKPGWRDTLKEVTPLLILGAAVFLALRAGLFNIGADGQFLVGSMVAAWLALLFPGLLGILLAILGGIAGGALWAIPAGWIKAYRGGHEVITTIMLNNIAAYLTVAIVSGPLRDPEQQSPTTDLIDASTRLPNLVNAPPFRMNLALVVGILIVVGLWFWLRKTVAGFELEATGANLTAARAAGVPVKRVVMQAMTTSGALAGLAGAVQVLAYENRFYAGFSPGYGFDALGVALLSGSSAWGLLPSALLFGIISKGTSAVQLMGVPKGMSGVLLGLLIIAFAAYRYRREAQIDRS